MHVEYTRRLLDSFPEIAFSLDATGQIVVANRKACVNLDYSRAEIEGRPLAEFVNPENAPATDFMKLWRGTNGPLPVSLHMRARGGKVVAYQANGGNIAATGEPANLIVRCVLKQQSIVKFSELTKTIADLSEELHRRRALEIALRKAKDAAEIVSSAKSQFLAMNCARP